MQGLLSLDAKSFNMGDYVTRITSNTVDIYEVFERHDELATAMLAANTEQNYDLFVLLVTILSTIQNLVIGDNKDKVGEAFNVQLENGTAFLPGVVSRKKQDLKLLKYS